MLGILNPLRCKLTIAWRRYYFKEDIAWDFKIFFPVSIAALGQGLISIGKGCKIGEFSTIRAGGYKIYIGDDVTISNLAAIISNNLGTRKCGVPMREQMPTGGDIIIKNGAWLANGSTILPDVTVGEGAIISAGAVVSSDVPDYAIVAGNPARIIGYRK